MGSLEFEGVDLKARPSIEASASVARFASVSVIRSANQSFDTKHGANMKLQVTFSTQLAKVESSEAKLNILSPLSPSGTALYGGR